MISLLLASQKELSADSAQAIFELLNISPTPDITDFLDDPDEDGFYAFFFDVLIENDIPCALDIDWKWSPENLFWQLERYFTKNTLRLMDSEWIPSEDAYRIEYELDGQLKTFMASFDYPGYLLDSISQNLKDRMFVALNFQEDRYSWLIVPNNFNTELFCTLTGLTIEEPAPKDEIPENFAENYKQAEKLFFNPSIIYVDENQTGYTMPGQVWAGRILPGQTIKEGIATELKAELNYSGRFDYSYDKFEGIFKDRKGRDIKRYDLTVYLFDKTFQSKMAGETDIRLKKIPNKTFYHPDSSLTS